MGEQRSKQRGSLSVVRGNATTQNVTYGSEANAMETRFAEGQHRIDCRIFANECKKRRESVPEENRINHCSQRVKTRLNTNLLHPVLPGVHAHGKAHGR